MELTDGCGFSKAVSEEEEDDDDDNSENPAANGEELITSMLECEPATQPYDDLSVHSDNDCGEGSQEDLNPVWGVLYPIRDRWRAARLAQDVSTFGRSIAANTFAIGEDEAGAAQLLSISKVHFAIERSGSGVVLADRSSNGTFVNGKLVGKGKSRHLEHNSTIALADPKRPSYVYMSTSRDFQRDYPRALTSRWVVSRDLGSGACGVVKLGFRYGDVGDRPHRCAIKIIDKRKVPTANGGSVANEATLLRKLDHPCVVRLHEAIDTDRFLCIVLELADGGELFDRIVEKSRVEEPEAKVVFRQLLSAIDYLHSKKVAHRDLKPENVLLTFPGGVDRPPLVKITDLGLSKLVDGSKLKTFCGTPQYLAPEVLMSRVRGDGCYGFEVDMWSLGVILYVLLSGCPPFSAERTDKTLVRQVCDADYSFPASKWAGVSEDAVDLVRKLIVLDRKKRLTAKEALAHRWTDRPEVRRAVEELMEASRRGRESSSGVMGPPKPIVSEPREEEVKNNPRKKMRMS